MPLCRTVRVFAFIFSACLAAFGATGCGSQRTEGGEGADIEDFPETEAPEAESIDLSGQIGQVVTVTSRVGEPQPHSFSLGAGTFGNDPVLVVGRELPKLAPGDLVEVTGIVRDYAPADLEREVGADLDKEALDGYEHAIVATDVEVVQPAGAAGEER